MKNEQFLNRLGYAVSGIAVALRSERSIQTQVFFAFAAAGLVLVLRPEPVWWALVGVMIAVVLAAELFNTALENLADHLHPSIHPKIRIAKDCAAGAVLLLSAAAVWVAAWMLISEL